ncbi:hypothetical protein ACJA88_014696 [Fusarium oxysporum]
MILGKDEEKIACFLSAVDAMLDRCEPTAQNTTRVLLCWLASSRLDTYQPKPFALRIEEDTRKKYRRLWKRFIAFTLRAYLLSAVVRVREVNIRLDPRIPIWKRIQCDHESSEDDDEGFEASEREDSLDDWISDTESRDAPDVSLFREDPGHKFSDETAVKTVEKFLELLFELSLSLSMEAFVSPDRRRFQVAREYCPSLSGLIWVQRLIFLEYALPLHSYPTIGIQQRPQLPMQRLNEVRQKYMVQGSLSPLAELHNLRHFRQKVAKTEPPPFILRWSDDGKIVSYGSDFTLSMQEFRGLADHFIARAEELCDELMYGFEPNLDISKTKDDFTNAQPGFPFVSHPDNGFEAMYQDLLVQVCTSHGPPRIRELWSLAAENSPCAVRGIFAWNGSVAYALRHHKAQRSTNQEFYVVRFLPARLVTVVVKHLVCIRRVAALLRREQSGLTNPVESNEQKHLLLQQHDNPQVTTPMMANSKQPVTVAGRKRKRISYDGASRSTKKTFDSSPPIPTYAAVRIDGLAAILPEYPILICLICKTAVRPGKGIESHFRHAHRVKAKMLKAVNALHSEWTYTCLPDTRRVKLFPT